MSLNLEEHKARHDVLHKCLDELIADYITHTDKRPSSSTIFEIMIWSASQVEAPTES